MQAKLQQLLNRLEALNLRERALLLVMVPVVLALLGEFLVFEPARKQAVAAIKQAERQQSEMKDLATVLAAKPAVAPLPGADQLMQQRDALLAPINAARIIKATATQGVDWGTVVRAGATGKSGLGLAQLRTLPAEVVFSASAFKPEAVQPARPGASAAGTAAAAAPARPAAGTAMATAGGPGVPGAGGESIYRHRAELTVKGDLTSLLGYLQALQRVEGGLHWDRLQLSMDAYPQATAQLSLFTLSNRAETPFY